LATVTGVQKKFDLGLGRQDLGLINQELGLKLI